jgi:hypothetical protein
MKEDITDHSLSGLSLHGISPPILHSQFMDDILMMGLPTVWEATCNLSVINLFFDASGMDVNLTKSQIFLFNTPIQVQLHITQLLEFTHNSLPFKYLEIPLIENLLRNTSWKHLLSKFRKILDS